MKSTLPKFSLCIKFLQGLSIFLSVRDYCLEVACAQTLQV